MNNIFLLGLSVVALAGCATQPAPRSDMNLAGNAYAAAIILERCPKQIMVAPGKELAFNESRKIGYSILGSSFRKTNRAIIDMEDILRKPYGCPALASGLSGNAALSVFLVAR